MFENFRFWWGAAEGWGDGAPGGTLSPRIWPLWDVQASDRGSTWANIGGMWKSTAATVTAALPRGAWQISCPAPTISSRMPYGKSGDTMSLGHFPARMGVNHYILTGMDYFTKWPEAYSLPDQEADMSARGWHFELGE